jgi:predicted HNH restriction endonuclease
VIKDLEKRRQSQRDHYYRNKEQYLKRNRERKKKLKKQWLEFKGSLSCEMCGEDHISTFDFHHIEKHPDNRAVNRLVSDYNFKEAYEEIKKCMVLCANCHRKLHHQERIDKKKKKKRKKKRTQARKKGNQQESSRSEESPQN